MERKTIPLLFRQSEIPLVRFRLGDKMYYAIVDTGSEVSIIDEEMKDKIKTREINAETSLVGVNGGTGYRNLVQGACYATMETKDGEEVKVVLGGMLNDLSALSCHFRDEDGQYIPISIIIGGDFLSHYKALIDYRNNSLSIKSD